MPKSGVCVCGGGWAWAWVCASHVVGGQKGEGGWVVGRDGHGQEGMKMTMGKPATSLTKKRSANRASVARGESKEARTQEAGRPTILGGSDKRIRATYSILFLVNSR